VIKWGNFIWAKSGREFFSAEEQSVGLLVAGIVCHLFYAKLNAN